VTQFLFNKVCSFETLDPVSANFDSTCIVYRDYFEFELNYHATGADWQPFMVEAFLVSSSTPDQENAARDIDSLVICTLEEPGRAMLFPAFRFGCLRLSSMSRGMRSSVSAASTHLTLKDYENNQFTLKCPNDSQFLLWKTQLLKLFPESLEPTVNLSNSISNLHKHTVSTSTSCYSFKSTHEEILTQPFHGLNIISDMTNVRSSFDLPRWPLSSDICSPKLDNLPFTPSLIDAPELKAFMSEDCCSFDKPGFPRPFTEEFEILNSANISVSNNGHTDACSIKELFVTIDCETFEDSKICNSFEYHNKAEESEDSEDIHTVTTIDTSIDISVDTGLKTVDSNSDDMTQSSDFSLTGILENNANMATADTNTIELPVSVLPNLPKNIPSSCPNVPILKTVAESKFSYEIDLPKPANTYYSSPLLLPSIISRKLQSSDENSRLARPLSHSTSLEALEKGKSPSAALNRKLSEGSLTRKLSKKRRLVSAFKRLSHRLKPRSFNSALDAEFEMLNPLPSEQPVLKSHTLSDFSYQPVPLCDTLESVPDSGLNEVSLTIKKRSERVLSRISEEQFLSADKDDSGATNEVISCVENSDRENYYESLDSSSQGIISSAVTAVIASPFLVTTASRRASAVGSSYTLQKLEIFEQDEDDFVSSCMSSFCVPQTDIAGEDKLQNTTFRLKDTGMTPDGLELKSIQHKISQDSVESSVCSASAFFSHCSHSRCSSGNSTASQSIIKKSGSDATLIDADQHLKYAILPTASDIPTLRKLRRSNLTDLLLDELQPSLRTQTAVVFTRSKNSSDDSWIPISENFLTVSVSTDGRIINCWRSFPTSISNDSLKTIYEPISEPAAVNGKSAAGPNGTTIHSIAASTSGFVSTSITESEGEPLCKLELGTGVSVLKKSMYNVMVGLGSGNEYLFQLRSQTAANEFYRAISPHTAASIPETTRQKLIKRRRHRDSYNADLPTGATASRSLIETDASGRPLMLPPLLSSRAGQTDTNTSGRTSPEPLVLLSDQRCLLFTATNASPDRWAQAGLARLTVSVATGQPRKLDWRHVTLHQIDTDEVIVDARLPATCFCVAGPVALSITDPKTGHLKYLVRLRDQTERDRVAAVLVKDNLTGYWGDNN
jgi:hypothetical protein